MQQNNLRPSVQNTSHNISSLSQNQSRNRITGYVLGPPIAYTNQPYLPSNFQPFSPDARSLSPPPVNFQYSSGMPTPPKKVQITSEPIRYANITTSVHPSYYQAPHIGDTVSRIEYQRCAIECKNWQTKYNQLYLKYMKANSMNNGVGDNELRQQNMILRQRIKQLQGRQRQCHEMMEIKFTDLVNNYRQSTLKQCKLLMDRYKLQCKNAERDRY